MEVTPQPAADRGPTVNAQRSPASRPPLAKTTWKTVGQMLAGHKVDKSKVKRVIAGKEVGCKFYFLFHTGCVGPTGMLDVPLHMMDKVRSAAHKRPECSRHGDSLPAARFRFALNVSMP